MRDDVYMAPTPTFADETARMAAELRVRGEIRRMEQALAARRAELVSILRAVIPPAFRHEEAPCSSD